MGFRNIDELCEQLKAKREAANAGGGDAAIAKQKAKGKARLARGSISCLTRVRLSRSTSL